MGTIIYILLALLLLGIMVTVHELGHFCAARACGIAVREIAYSLGFENEFYFSRIFKIKTKKSPVAYRNWSR